MVKTGYPAIWQPVRFEMLGLANATGGPVQKIMFAAAYEMRLIGGIWRINGVFLRALPGASS